MDSRTEHPHALPAIPMCGALLAAFACALCAGGAAADSQGPAASDLTVKRFMVFVPARDFALSKRFYLELGAKLVDDGQDYAEFQWGQDRFILRDQYQKEWAEQFAVHVIVSDAEAFARRVAELIASGDFSAARVEDPRDEPWGYRVTYVRDPSGVGLHFAEPRKKPAAE